MLAKPPSMSLLNLLDQSILLHISHVRATSQGLHTSCHSLSGCSSAAWSRGTATGSAHQLGVVLVVHLAHTFEVESFRSLVEYRLQQLELSLTGWECQIRHAFDPVQLSDDFERITLIPRVRNREYATASPQLLT